MTTQDTKEKVSLNDLRRDIEEFEYAKTRYTKHDGDYQAARADAWRTAFMWRDRIHHRYRAVDVFSNAWEVIDKEHGEGMALIQEKLQS